MKNLEKSWNFVSPEMWEPWMGTLKPSWWLVRVTLVVDWLFLPQHFGLVAGTYEGLLPFCECRWGGGSICRWWGHLTTICGNRTFCTDSCGTLKPSITYPSPLAPSHPLIPLLSLAPCPNRDDGTLKPTITYPLLPFAPSHRFPPSPHRGGGDPKT